MTAIWPYCATAVVKH